MNPAGSFADDAVAVSPPRGWRHSHTVRGPDFESGGRMCLSLIQPHRRLRNSP